MSLVNISARVFKETKELIDIIDFTKLKAKNKTDYVRIAVENQLINDGVETLEKAVAKGVLIKGIIV